MANPADDRTPMKLTGPREVHRLERWARRPLPPPAAIPATSDSIEPIELWHTLRRNWHWIALIAAVVMAAVSLVTLVSPMKFVSKARLYLGELQALKQAQVASPGAIDLTGGTEGDVSSELAILSSRGLVERAVLEAGLNVHLAPLGSEPLRYYEWRLHRRDPALLDVAARHVIPTKTTLLSSRGEPEVFAVHFESERDFVVWSGEKRLGTGVLGTAVELPGLALTLEEGTEGPPAVGTRLTMEVSPLDLVTESAMRSLDVVAPQQVGHEPIKVVTLSFTGTSPLLTARFLERLMADYLAERHAWKTETATAAEEFVTRQLQELQGSLDQVETELADYRSENRVVVHNEEAQAMVGQIGKYEEQRVAARLEVAALDQVERALKNPDAPVEAYMLGETEDTALESLAASLAQSKLELSNLKSRFQEAAPAVREQQAQVDAQLASIRGYVNGRLSRARANLGTLNGIIGQFEDKLKTVPGAELKLAQLARESEVYSSIYSFLLQKQQQAAITKASNVSQNRILDIPQVPRKEDSPKLAFVLASGPVGLVLGAGLVLMIALLGGTLQSERDVLRTLGSVPVFARIPRRARRRFKPVPISEFDAGDDDAAFIEAFRTLRTRLGHALQGQGQSTGSVILISSPSAGDGKTTCTFALASMLAAAQKRVLVLDTDLREPSHARLLAKFAATVSPASERHASRLDAADRSEWAETPRPISGSFGSFDALSFSEAVPTELLSSDQMVAFLGQLRTSYDFVLLDSAAYPLTSDALALAAEADAILTVLRLHETSRQRAQEHMLGLSGFGIPHALVLNDSSARGPKVPRGPVTVLEARAPHVRHRVSEQSGEIVRQSRRIFVE